MSRNLNSVRDCKSSVANGKLSASRHALGVNLALDRVFFSLQEEIIVTLFQFKGLCAPGLFRSAESTISDDFSFRDFTRELTYKIFLNSNILRIERGNLLDILIIKRLPRCIPCNPNNVLLSHSPSVILIYHLFAFLFSSSFLSE